MEQEAEGQMPFARRLDEAFLQIELYYGDHAEQSPRDHLRERRVGQRVFLAEQGDHFGRLSASARASEPLQKGRYRIRRVDLQYPLQSADIHAQLQCHRGASHGGRVLVFQAKLRLLAQGRRKVAVVYEKPIRLAPISGDLPQGRGHVFGLLAGIGKDKALLAPCAVVQILIAGIERRASGRRVGGFGFFLVLVLFLLFF